jgi:hypothetical protein
VINKIPGNPNKNLEDLINEFSNFQNTRNIFLYTSIEWSKKEIKKTNPFLRSQKRSKYVGLNWTKEVKEICTENWKKCWNKWKNPQSTGKAVHTPWFGDLIMLNGRSYLMVYSFTIITAKTSMAFLCWNGKVNSKFAWNFKGI